MPKNMIVEKGEVIQGEYIRLLKEAYEKVLRAKYFLEGVMGTGNSDEEYCEVTGEYYWRDMAKLVWSSNHLADLIKEEQEEL